MSRNLDDETERKKGRETAERQQEDMKGGGGV